jgi:hypothetical protein
MTRPNTTYEGGSVFAPVIFHGGSGQGKHVLAIEWMRDHWPSKTYVDDMPVVLRLDCVGCRDATAHRQRLAAFVALVESGCCAIGICIGDADDVQRMFHDAGCPLPAAVELIPVQDAHEYYDNRRQLGLRWAD